MKELTQAVADELARYMHSVRTAFAVYQGNAYLQKRGAVSIETRQDSARRLIQELRETEAPWKEQP